MKKLGLKTLATSVVSIAMVFSMVGMTVAQAAALTSAQVSAIVSLLQSFGADAGTVANVEATLSGTPVTSMPAMTSGTSAYTFTSDLTIGSTGAAVTALQNILIAQGDLAMPAGVAEGYFGALTQAALAKFQTANGITPAAGYFGAKTRAFVNGMGGGVSVTPVTGATTGTVTSAGSVSVALAATSPVNSTIVSPSATALLAQYVFTGSGQVNSVVLQRTGVSSDNTLVNVYLYSGATRLTDAATVANGVISFNNPNGLFTVNGSQTISVRADVASSQGGETVGVSLTSLQTSGATAAVNVNVMGSTQSIANNGNPAGVTIGAQAVVNSSVNAGTVNYNVWQAPVTVSTRSVYLDALTLKYIGSAPASAFQNLSLYVDGSKVSTATINGNDFAVFDLSASPYTLTTGSHTVSVHADIVGGANYNGSFTLQNEADIMLADSQLQGVYVAALTQSQTIFTQNVGGTISINAGSITVSQDPSFVTTQVTGGSTNVAIAQYLLQDFGESVKVSQLTVLPVLSGASASTGDTGSLNNVGLYVNGAQVGSLTNWSATTSPSGITFNLGSSLVVQAGQTVTLTVKADTINSVYGNYTGGNLSVVLSGPANNAQGLTSNALSTIPAASVTSNALTLGVGQVTLAKNTAYANQSILANTPNQEIGSFILQQNSSENAQLTGITVGVVGSLPLTSLSNLRTSITTTPIGQVASSSNFSVNNIINENTSQEIDVFADVGAIPTGTVYTYATGTVSLSGYFDSGKVATTTVNGTLYSFTSNAASTTGGYMATQLAAVINAGSLVTATATTNANGSGSILLTSKVGGATGDYTLTAGGTGGTVTAGAATLVGGTSTVGSSATITTTLSATAQGQTSHAALTINGNGASGQNITLTGGSLSIGSTIVNTSPTSQYVVGGSTFPVAIYNAVSSVGQSTITEMDFTVTNNSTISSVTVGNQTAAVVGTSAIVTGLSIAVPSGYAGVNIPVSVTYSKVGQNGLTTDGLTSTLALSLVKSQSGTGSIVTLSTSPLPLSANNMTLVASKPTVTVANAGSSVTLGLPTELIDVTVSADAAGDINLDSLPITVTANGSGLSVGTQTLVVEDQNGNTITTATGTLAVSANSSATTSVSFLNGVSTGYRIPAGTSQTFKIFANPTGYSGTAGTLSIGAQVGSASFFKWTDIQGGSAESGLTGSAITNWPTVGHTASN